MSMSRLGSWAERAGYRVGTVIFTVLYCRRPPRAARVKRKDARAMAEVIAAAEKIAAAERAAR